MTVSHTKVNNILDVVIPDTLERVVVHFDKVRRELLRRLHLNAESAYLLRQASQPDGVRLTTYRDEVGITEARASQIVHSLVATGLLIIRRDQDYGRAKIVEITEAGRKTLAELDAAIEKVLIGDLAITPEHNGSTSHLRDDIVRLYEAVKPKVSVATKPNRRVKPAG